MEEGDDHEPSVDRIDRILSNNPGNFTRQKAVAVDLSELEYIRKELVE